MTSTSTASLKPTTTRTVQLEKLEKYEEEQAKAKLEQDEELMMTFAAVFNSFDKDNDGTINRAELMVALRSLGISIPQEKFSKFMESIDTDGDGRIDSIEFEGLCKSVLDSRVEGTNVDGNAYTFSNDQERLKCFV